MITEDDVKEVVSRYPNLELQILKTFGETKRLLVYINSKLFQYGKNLLLEYDYCGVPKNGILQVNNGNQHIYSDWDWAYTTYKNNIIYLCENKNMKKKVRDKKQFEQLIINSLKMIKEVEMKIKISKIKKDFS